MGHSRPLFRSFSPFQTTITIFKTNICEKYPSSIRWWNSNPLHESPPIITRPGLPSEIRAFKLWPDTWAGRFNVKNDCIISGYGSRPDWEITSSNARTRWQIKPGEFRQMFIPRMCNTRNSLVDRNEQKYRPKWVTVEWITYQNFWCCKCMATFHLSLTIEPIRCFISFYEIAVHK